MTQQDDTLWQELPVPALLLAADETILKVNSAAEDFLNQSSKSLTGASFWSRVTLDADLHRAFARARETGSELVVGDVLAGGTSGNPLLCTLNAGPAGNGGLLVLFSPRELASRQARVSRSGGAARAAIGMAEMLAHEIKNPLAGITGAAQLVSMSLGAEDRELTDLIVEESRRIVALLDQVEQFGNLSPPGDDAVNVHDVLDRARRSALVGFGAHMRIVEDYDPSLPPTRGDGDQLVQVIQNLLKNASEAAPKGGVIRLRTWYDAGLRLRRTDGTAARLPLQIEVVDDGPGLPAAIAEAVFEPFVSGRENGSGLGLALVSKIIGDHGGWITVDSAPGRTAFRISLPLADQGER